MTKVNAPEVIEYLFWFEEITYTHTHTHRKRKENNLLMQFMLQDERHKDYSEMFDYSSLFFLVNNFENIIISYDS